MACCAFAFFIVSQLLWPVRWLRAQFGVNRNDVVSWPLADGRTQPQALASTAALLLATSTLLIATVMQLAPHEQICTADVARSN